MDKIGCNFFKIHFFPKITKEIKEGHVIIELKILNHAKIEQFLRKIALNLWAVLAVGVTLK